MEEQVDLNEGGFEESTDTETAPETAPEPAPEPAQETDGPDYMAGINRILTSLLAGLIGSALLLFGLYFGGQLLGQSLGTEGQFSIQFLLLATLVVFVSLVVTQIIQMYFYKLVEKETYMGIGSKVYKNFIAQLVLLILVFPFTFIFLSFSQLAVGVLFGIYLVFSLATAVALRESNNGARLVGSMLGLAVATMLSVFMFYSLDNVQALVSVVVLPIALVVSSLFELFTDFVTNLVLKS